MKKNLFLILFFFSCLLNLRAQDITQNIRGRIIDKESKIPLTGATVVLVSDTSKFTGTTADINGYFRLDNVAIGRQTLKISFIGYKEQVIANLIVISGKENILNLELEESVTNMKEVEITATKKDQAINEMALVSARTFSVEETDRYAGSRGDPARMASNYAGAQGADDSRNDIVVRGNSPMGVLWRLEGVNIPNPNHFAVVGSTGGPVSILNNKVLDNSDFMTGAFPAEYGNSIAGVFDLKMRSGNNEKHEFTGQFGFLGTELTAEGPISKEKRSSYLATYRYSTLKMFEAMKIKIGTSAVPNYQDASFKLNFPTNKGNLSFFGIGGKSNIAILVSNFTEPQDELYGEKDRDQYFNTSMGVAGVSYTHLHNSTTYSKLVLSGSLSQAQSRHDLVFRNNDYQLDSLVQKLGYTSLEGKTSLAYFVNKKLNARHSLKAGFFIDRYSFNMFDSLYNEKNYSFETRLDHTGDGYLAQPYVQYKFKVTDDIVFNAGLHGQVLLLNNSTAIEPRAGVRWNFSPKQAISFGAGMHSQMQPTYIYFQQVQDVNGNYVQHNHALDFTRSNHFVLTYDYSPGNNLRFKTETYYQQLYDVPVEITPSAYSILNQGSGFNRFFPDSLVNEGTGQNYGLEFTLEKFFSRKFFFLATVSIYESTYKGSDGVERNTDFNGRFATNLLTGKEFKTGKKSSLGLGNKITMAGGRRYTPVDIYASSLAGDAVYVDVETNTRQFRNYFRADIKINYKINRAKVTHEIALDLVNILNTKNVLALSYAPNPNNPLENPLREEYQLGFLPLFYYKLDF